MVFALVGGGSKQLRTIYVDSWPLPSLDWLSWKLRRRQLEGIVSDGCGTPVSRVSFETSFDSKQPKLEPKLVSASALSETQRLFRLFRFYTETESFDVVIEPKQTKDKPKQFDREHILQFFTENLWFFRFFRFFRFFSRFFRFFRFFSGFFGLFRNSLFRCFGCFASITKQRVLIDPKQTEDPPKQFKRDYIWVFFRKFRVVSFCFGLLQNSYVCFGCFDICSKHRSKPKLFVIGYTKQTKQTRNRSCFGLFRFEPKIIFVCFEDTLPVSL